MPTSHSTRLALLPCVALLAAALVGCSSDDSSDASADPSVTPSTSTSSSPSPSASTAAPDVDGAEAVCSAYRDAAAALSQVRNDLKSKNIGKVHTSLDAAGDAFDDLQSSVQELASGVRATVEARVNEVADQVEFLAQATSIEQFKAGFSVIQLEGPQLATDLETNLSCS